MCPLTINLEDLVEALVPSACRKKSTDFRRCTQIKDPNATIAVRGPWVPLVVETVVPTACQQALGTRASTNFNLPQLASRRCAVRAPDSSAIFRSSGDVPIAGESCLMAAGTPPLQSAVFDQRSVDKDNAVTLHQDLLSLRCRSWFKILTEKQHSHRLYHRFSK